MLPYLKNWRGYICVFGAFLIHFSLGSIYTFGNMSPYMASYFQFVKKQNISMGVIVWIFAISIGSQALSMPFGGLIEKKIGARLTTLLGGWIMSAGVILSYFTIKVNLISLIITHGLAFGIGVGLAYSVAIASSIKWFPKKKGLVIGIVVGGFGLGSLIFNQVQTAFINPKNLQPNVTIHVDRYFDNIPLLDRVPYSFLVTGVIYAVMQLIGSLLLFDASAQPHLETQPILQTTYSLNSVRMDNGSTEVCFLEPESVRPVDALKMRDFWILWTIFLFNGTANIFITSLYKTFGAKFIMNDRFLAITGSVSAIFNSGGRIMWGKVMDVTSFRVSMRAITVCATIFLATFYLETLAPENSSGVMAMHIIWVCCMLGCVCGTFATLPSATAIVFGTDHVAVIYGMVFTANAFSGIIGALLTTELLPKIHYVGIFEIGAGLTTLSFCATFFFKSDKI